MPPPLFDQDLCLAEIVEDLSVQQLVAEAGVEALAIAILPRRSGLDISRFRPNGADPIPNGQGDKFQAIVGTNEGGNAKQDEQVGQCIDGICRVQPAPHPDRQTFAAELV